MIHIEIINKILEIKKKTPLKSLKNYDMEMEQEELNYLYKEMNNKNNEFNDYIQEMTEKEKEIITFKNKNKLLVDKTTKLNKEIILFSDKLNYKDKLYQDEIKEIKIINDKMKNTIKENNSLFEQIDSLKIEISLMPQLFHPS